MFDLVYFLQLLEKKWPYALTMVCLVLFCFWATTRDWRYGFRAVAVAVSIVCIFFTARGLYMEYYLLALGNEVDVKAERAFDTIKPRLSDGTVIHLLSRESRGHNQRFYIALIAAERNLDVPNARDIYRPGFFSTNSYTSFANRLHYPITYRELLRKYQETFERKQPRN